MSKRKQNKDENTKKKAYKPEHFSATAKETMGRLDFAKRSIPFTPILKDFPILKPAMEFSFSHGILPVFALDKSPNTKDPTQPKNSKKMYFVCGYLTFMDYLFSLEQSQRCFYEVIYEHVPCHLMVDAEIYLKKNPPVDIETIDASFKQYVLNQFLIEKICTSVNEITIRELDSSNDYKFSRHYIFQLDKNRMFKNNYHCGAFIRKVRNSIQLDPNEKKNANENRFFFIGEKGEITFFADMRIYTQNRIFRLFGNSKRGVNSFLLPIENGKKEPLAKEYQKPLFTRYFIQKDASKYTTLVECKNPDQSEPTSTSDSNIFRVDFEVKAKKKSAAYRIEKETLFAFYRDSYPFTKIWEMAGHPRREFTFEFPGKIYARFLKFQDVKEFREAVLKRVPEVIHIGPILSEKNKEVVEKRELIFDIDLNDYKKETGEPLRACCKKEEKCCAKCWRFIRFARLIMNQIIGKSLGMKELVYFFSGNKGLHCWVFDERASKLSSRQRNSLLELLKADKINLSLPLYKEIHRLVTEGDEFNKLLTEQKVSIKDCNSPIEQLRLIWPRFDAGVTNQDNHLIKSPYLLHPKSKKLCILLENDEFPE